MSLHCIRRQTRLRETAKAFIPALGTKTAFPSSQTKNPLLLSTSILAQTQAFDAPCPGFSPEVYDSILDSIEKEHGSDEEHPATALNPTLCRNFMKLCRQQPLTAQEQVDLITEFRYLDRCPRQLKALRPDSTWHIDQVSQWFQHAKHLQLLRPNTLYELSEFAASEAKQASTESLVQLLDCYAWRLHVPTVVHALKNEITSRTLSPPQASLTLSALARLREPCTREHINRLCEFLLAPREDVFQDCDLWPHIEGTNVAAPRATPSLCGRDLAQATWAMEELNFLRRCVGERIAERAMELLPDKCTVQEMSMILSYLAKSSASVESLVPVFSYASIGLQRRVASASSVVMADVLSSFALRGFDDESLAQRVIAQLPRTYSSPNASPGALRSMVESFKMLDMHSDALEDYAPAMIAERSALERA